MWKSFVLSGKTAFIRCQIKESSAECIVFDLAETWSVNETLTDVVGRVKNLNKRIRFDEATIRKIFEEVQPEQAAWTNNDDEINCIERILTIKYRVNSCPFNFEWRLKKQNETELKELLLLPLVKCVDGFQQQKAELLDVLRKKDIEIQQYKMEFGNLRIKTVATQPFNAFDFEQKFSDVNVTTTSWSQVAQHWKTLTQNNFEPEKITQTATTNTKTAIITTKIKTEDSPKNNNNSSSTKNGSNIEKKLESPRNKKRKVREAHIQRKMNTRKQKLEYENSQGLIDETANDDCDNR